MAHITFRTHLIGSVTDFCSESHLPFVTPDILAGLIVRLSHYQEEGVQLQPQVYLTDNINALMSMLPGGERLQLATTTANVEGIDRMLKVCAPIATTEWRIFCHHHSNNIMEFGVFRGSINPIAVDLDEVILAAQDNVSIIKIHHVASNCVHVRHSRGADRYVFFDHRKEDSPQPLQYVDDFVKSVTRNVEAKDKDAVLNYLTKVLTAALIGSHGCIWTVTNMSKVPQFLAKDGVLLDVPIDFQQMIANAPDEGVELESFNKKADLVRGMLRSDGISVFDDRGRLLGYRCFISTSQPAGVIGGARKRAFFTLTKHLRRGLSAVLVQSQDGATQFEGASNG